MLLGVLGSLVCAALKEAARVSPQRCLIIPGTPQTLQQCASQLCIAHATHPPGYRRHWLIFGALDLCCSASSFRQAYARDRRPLLFSGCHGLSVKRAMSCHIRWHVVAHITSSLWFVVSPNEILGLGHHCSILRRIFSFQRACSAQLGPLQWKKSEARV